MNRIYFGLLSNTLRLCLLLRIGIYRMYERGSDVYMYYSDMFRRSYSFGICLSGFRIVFLVSYRFCGTDISCHCRAFYADTVIGSSLSLSLDTAEVKKKTSFFRRFLNYFNDANKPKPRKKFDFSIIGGPHYSSDTKLGLGLVAAGLYQGKDTLMQPSMVSLYGDVSTTGFYLLGVKGTHFFPEDKYRLLYNLYFFSFPGYFWGTGYEAGSNDDNK